MAAQAAGFGAGWREWAGAARACRGPLAVAALIVILRSAVFVFWEQAHFDSDQAVVGLMAKHLAEGRAFPLFYYGQSYMLGVEAWLAAPVFLLIGPSVMALKLPLLAINVLVASLFILILHREVGLGGWWALTASLFFVLAPPAAAVRLVEANGGSVEPFLYVLLLWMARGRPALFGAILGFGFLHREFTAYGAAAVVFLAVVSGRAWARGNLRRVARAAVALFAVVALVQVARIWSSPLGPGSRGSLASVGATNVGQLSQRFVWAPDALGVRFEYLRHRHIGVLFGTAAHPLWKLTINSATTWQGLSGLGTLMLAALAVVLIRMAVGLRQGGARFDTLAFPLYLVVLGVASVLMYWSLSHEPVIVETLRYGLLALSVPIGVGAAFFALERGRWWKGAVAGVLLCWAGVSATSHARLIAEYLAHPPANDARGAVEALEAQGVRLAHSRHSIAFWLTFLARERLILSSDDFPRVTEYQDRVAAAGAGADFIGESPCPGGVRLADRFHRCPR